MAWANYPKGYGKKSKYKAQKAQIRKSDGSVESFDSKKEARRFVELRFMEQAGKVENLQRQVKFVLIPAQREEDRIGKSGGIIKGKVIEREVAYYADFVYSDRESGETVVEDVKGIRTKEYILKRKMMLYFHGIRIKEI